MRDEIERRLEFHINNILKLRVLLNKIISAPIEARCDVFDTAMDYAWSIELTNTLLSEYAYYYSYC